MGIATILNKSGCEMCATVSTLGRMKFRSDQSSVRLFYRDGSSKQTVRQTRAYSKYDRFTLQRIMCTSDTHAYLQRSSCQQQSVLSAVLTAQHTHQLTLSVLNAVRFIHDQITVRKLAQSRGIASCEGAVRVKGITA